MKKFIVLIVVLLLGSVGFAASGGSGVLASLGFFKFDQEFEGSQIGNGKNLNTFYDFKLGYLFSNNFYAGGIYSVANQDNGSSQPKRSLYGVTLGYHNSGWYLDGSYFLAGEYDTGATVYKKPSGLGIDLGYEFMVNSNFFFGLQGSYRTITFKEYLSGSTTSTSDNKIKSEISPMLVLGVIF
ncbi:MAG: hypothetical protein ACXWC9_09460 [Pseudobdellovibrionaceae bacterium]